MSVVAAVACQLCLQLRLWRVNYVCSCGCGVSTMSVVAAVACQLCLRQWRVSFVYSCGVSPLCVVVVCLLCVSFPPMFFFFWLTVSLILLLILCKGCLLCVWLWLVTFVCGCLVCPMSVVEAVACHLCVWLWLSPLCVAVACLLRVWLWRVISCDCGRGVSPMSAAASTFPKN